MKGIWLENSAATFRDDLAVPRAGGMENCLVRLSLAGICSTDLAMLDGLYPFTGVMGHEFTGVVEEGPGALRGCRVAGEINISCGECPPCHAGRSKHCQKRSVLGMRGHDGVFAEYVTLPARNLHLVPDAVPDEAAVFTEPLAAALDVLEQVEITPDTRLLLVGAGRLGQLIARALATSGCDLWVVIRDPAKAERLATTGARLISASDIEGGVFDVAVECTGNDAGLAMALAALRPRGNLVLKSTYPATSRVDMSRVVVDEIRITGSRCGPFDKALALMAERDLHLEALIDAFYPLERGLEALEKSRQPGVLKVLIKP
ncbi:MAG: alcohol dehydrogenase catalytic domain-containing protein [Proteobacteria bacterium]|nr:alcohol dehydrogenase catalytic domain-containing protein [Pseudomonadota bacterium]